MKNLLITGASKGIGRATAIETNKRFSNVNIIILSRSLKDLSETKTQMEKTNKSNTIHCVGFDLSELDEISKLMKDLTDKFGPIDILLNVAGYANPKPLLMTSIEDLERTYRINVFAPILLAKEFTKNIRHKSAKIVNVSSTAGITPRPGWLSYSSSKAALISVSMTLTEELSEYGIKIYTISPGRCATDLRRQLAPDEDQSLIMQPSEVAKVIADLIGDDENVLDGQNIIVRRKSS